MLVKYKVHISGYMTLLCNALIFEIFYLQNMSFHHVEWVPMEQIEGEHLGKHRVKKFLQKWNAEGQRGEDFREHLKVNLFSSI